MGEDHRGSSPDMDKLAHSRNKSGRIDEGKMAQEIQSMQCSFLSIAAANIQLLEVGTGNFREALGQCTAFSALRMGGKSFSVLLSLLIPDPC